METTEKRKFIDSIQILRLIAAFFVILLHCDIYIVGASSPDLFFVISGFIIMYTTDENSKIKYFLPKRFIRLVPLYWMVTIFTYCILLVKPKLSMVSEATPEYLVKSLFFIPFVNSKGLNFPITCVGWTLNYEILFIDDGSVDNTLNKIIDLKKKGISSKKRDERRGFRQL